MATYIIACIYGPISAFTPFLIFNGVGIGHVQRAYGRFYSVSVTFLLVRLYRNHFPAWSVNVSSFIFLPSVRCWTPYAVISIFLLFTDGQRHWRGASELSCGV